MGDWGESPLSESRNDKTLTNLYSLLVFCLVYDSVYKYARYVHICRCNSPQGHDLLNLRGANVRTCNSKLNFLSFE